MAGDTVCPTGCRAGSALFSRITLIILGLVGVWLFVVGILNLIVINQMPASARNSLSQATFIIDIVQVIVGFIVLIFVAYAIIAPQGTFNEYVKPYLEAPGDAGVTKLKRTTTTTTTTGQAY